MAKIVSDFEKQMELFNQNLRNSQDDYCYLLSKTWFLNFKKAVEETDIEQMKALGKYNYNLILSRDERKLYT